MLFDYMDEPISKIEIFFAVLALFFTVLLVLFYNYMRLLIKREKQQELEKSIPISANKNE
jgi:flagellar biogenesis protein FliO